MFHLLTAVTDGGAFPMRRHPRHEATVGAAPAIERRGTTTSASTLSSVDSRPLLSAVTGSARSTVWCRPVLCCGLLSLSMVVGAVAPRDMHAQSVTPASSREAKIANALTAGPEEIAKNATVKDWPSKEGEGLALLRQGTNGWVCLPDDATTPGNDPMCMDSTFHDAVAAFFAGQNPKVTRVGYAYMLTSDAEGSNTDPTARKATPTNQWHHAGPHVMILYPDAKLLEGLPTKPSAFGPYVMFPGLPIAHVMLPVQSGYAHRGSPNTK